MKEELINKLDDLYENIKSNHKKYSELSKEQIENIAAIQALKSITNFFENEHYKDKNPVHFIKNELDNDVDILLECKNDYWMWHTLNVDVGIISLMIPSMIKKGFNQNVELLEEIKKQNIENLNKEEFIDNFLEKICKNILMVTNIENIEKGYFNEYFGVSSYSDLLQKILDNDGFLFIKNSDFENEYDDQIEVEISDFTELLYEYDENHFAELLFEYVLNESHSYKDKLINFATMDFNYDKELDKKIDQKISEKENQKNNLKN